MLAPLVVVRSALLALSAPILQRQLQLPRSLAHLELLTKPALRMEHSKSAFCALLAMNALAYLLLPLPVKLAGTRLEKVLEVARVVLSAVRAPSLIKLLTLAQLGTIPLADKLLAQRSTPHQPALQVSSPTRSLTAAWTAPLASSAQLCMHHPFPALRASTPMPSTRNTARDAQLAPSALPLTQSPLVAQDTTPLREVLTATLSLLVWRPTLVILSPRGPLSARSMKFRASLRKSVTLAKKTKCVQLTIEPKLTAMVTE